MAANSELPQGTLEPVHGSTIAQRLQQVSRDVVQVPQGSLYAALHRLENRGLLAADWKETETGREAKFYRLTRKGRAALEAGLRSGRSAKAGAAGFGRSGAGERRVPGRAGDALAGGSVAGPRLCATHVAAVALSTLA